MRILLPKSVRGTLSTKKNIKKLFQRVALFSIAAVLAAGLGIPGAEFALAVSNVDRAITPNYEKVKALDAPEQNTASGLSEGPTSLEEPVDAKSARTHSYEDVSKRTAYSSTFVNRDGSKTLEWSPMEQNFKSGNTWEKINNKVNKVMGVTPKASLWQGLTNTEPQAPDTQTYSGDAGVIHTEMKPLARGLEIKADGKTFTMKPQGAKDVAPVQKDDRTTLYEDAWPGVDIEYELRGEAVKETIIIKKKTTQTTFDFVVDGGKVINHPTRQGELTIEGMPADFSFSALTLHVNERGVINENRATQAPAANGIAISVDGNWLKSQPDSAFPMRIDPTFSKQSEINYQMFRSDGYSCGSNNCYANIGAIDDNGWKNWRTYINFPYGELAGKTILNANLHGWFKYGVNGMTEGRYVGMGHSDCLAYTCVGPIVGQSLVGTDFDINFTNDMKAAVAEGNYNGTWWSLFGEEGGNYKSYKTYYDMKAEITYDTPTAMAQPAEPMDKQVTVDTQTTLKVNPINDIDGDKVKYYFRVSTSADAETGAVINSGWITSPQWNIPDGILQDGMTYYWHTYTMGSTQTNPNWVRSFKVDLRTGKDSTQGYDTIGPVGASLATGNASIGDSSHSMSALGGNIGLTFNYNTPNKAKKGLIGDYWNISSTQTLDMGPPKDSFGNEQKPVRTQREQNVDMNWGTDSVGGANADYAYARWQGLFVAPRDGQYTFGGKYDDAMAIYVNNNRVFKAGYNNLQVTYTDSIPVTLTAGQAIPIRVEYREATGSATAQLYVKGAVNEQIVPRDWLYTQPANDPVNYGLEGRYYTDDGTHNIDTAATDPARLMFTRQDTKMNLRFGADGPAPGMQGDNYMGRWTGYITAPTAGTYNLGAYADDGIRIKTGTGLFGAMETKVDHWTAQAGTYWSGNVTLEANKPTPIVVDWFEQSGNAELKLIMRGNGYGEQEIPVSWLQPKASALPDSWKLGVDVDGDVNYERLRVGNKSVILEDSTGSKHEYTWTGSGYKPPVNEDGVLSKNQDTTYTFIDADGRTYIFDAEGKLTSLTSPADDRQPASLKYEYSGDPSRLIKITDGVTSERYGTLHYKGFNEESMCGHPSGFDDTPVGMLCAFKTSDGNVTHLYYKSGQLARIEEPGNQIADYSYDEFGRIKSTRDSLAADAIAAGLRNDDDQALTQLSYDALGRLSQVKAPAATADATRLLHSLDYLQGATNMHVTGAAEPQGYSKRVEYDNLLRTTKEFDVTGKSGVQEWDPVKDLLRSSTDATGLKSTTLYDDNDKAIDSYGPAPQEWYQANGQPIADKVNQIPHVSTGYDEGMKGLAVAYHVSNAPKINRTLFNGQVMHKGDNRISLDRRFNFVYQNDGNLVLYGPSGVLWTANTAGKASTFLGMQSDGNLVLYNGSTSVWATNTSGGSSSQLNVQSDGNMVLVNSTNTLWSTNTGNWPAPGASSANLNGAPLLHTTNIASDNTISKNFGSTAPITTNTGSWGMRMTGKMRLPTTGSWKFRVLSDGGARVWIDDALVLDDWNDGAERSHATITYSNTTANALHRVRIDYYHTSNNASFTLYATPPGGVETTNVASYFTPSYSLKTSGTAYDALLGNVTTATTYSKPEYGTIDKTTADPSGLNLQASATFEAPGSGFLRQTGRTSPGGTSTSYSYYGANDSVDNPCTTENDPVVQGGVTKGKTEADPDGSGPKQSRTNETIYNASGKAVATKFNNDPWTCVSYDSRGRQTQSVQPTVNGRPGRTIDTQYAVGGNPFKTRIVDSVAGTTESVIDLLGRATSAKDVWGNDYGVTYDNYGNVTQKTGPLGTETYTYDTFFRLTSYGLNSTIFATVTYDEFGRVATVTYPEAKDAANNTLKLTQVKRDSIGRNAGVVYQTSDGKTFDESVVRSQLSNITNATQVYDNQSLTSSFVYDRAGRLTSGTVGQTKFEYGYGAPDAATCSADSANNALSNKNSNRTSYKVTNTATSAVATENKSCYNYADQLTYSTDTSIGTPTYDDHGNTASFSGNGVPLTFGYDANDANISVTQGTKRTEYVKSATGDVLRKKEFTSGQLTASYRYVAGGSILQTCSLTDDNNCTTVDRYLSLPGNVSLTLSPTNSDTTKRTVYSLHNYHGDTVLTLTNEGKTTVATNTLLAYGPFGESLIAGTQGTTAISALNATDSTMGWAADPARKQDNGYTTSFVQMGARVYIPSLGRFLQVDPVDGGTLNGYVYVSDPINSSDYNGQWGFGSLIAAIVAIVNVVRAVIKAVITPVIAAVRRIVSPAPSRVAVSGGGRSTTTRTPTRATSGGSKSTVRAASTTPQASRTGVQAFKIARPLALNPAPKFHIKQAILTASDYFAAGELLGGATMCVVGGGIGAAIGSAEGGVGAGPGAMLGCSLSAPIGVGPGGAIGGVAGFIIGGFNLPGQETFGGWDQAINPFKH